MKFSLVTAVEDEEGAKVYKKAEYEGLVEGISEFNKIAREVFRE